MAIVTSQTLSFQSSNNHRDASFSSYLYDDERISALLSEPEPDQNMVTTHCNSHEQIYTAKKKLKQTEIGVFSAEKYFRGAMDSDGNRKTTDNSSKRHQHEKNVLVNIDPSKPKVQPGTPSVRSASSCNSQTTLLPANHRHRKTKKAYCSSFLSTLRCSCTCNDKSSVVNNDHLEEHSGVAQGKAIIQQTKNAVELVQKNKIPSETWADQETLCKKFDEMGVMNRQECFNFPILNPKRGNSAAKLELSDGEDNATTKSLEVFGSPIVDHGKSCTSFERKSSMLTWDLVNPKKNEFGITENPNVDDSESDASSDLFEIESFSTKTNSFFGRQTSDGGSPCVTPTTCYAPSEASIEWSVVTASATEYFTVSDSEELRTAENTRNQKSMIRNDKSAAAGKGTHKRRPSILLGCKSQKAVRVAGDAYKVTDKGVPISQGHYRLESCKPVVNFQAETKLTGYGSRHGHNAFNARIVSPAHGSHLLYIQ